MELGVGVTVIMTYPTLDLVDVTCVLLPICVPYIPGFLAFREVPAIVASINLSNVKPDVILVNGHGVAHPRKLGLASHVGVVLNMPSIGVAKRPLIGSVVKSNDLKFLMHRGEVIGAFVRMKNDKEVVVSCGNKVTLNEAIEIIETCRDTDLPTPLRLADKLSKVIIKVVKDRVKRSLSTRTESSKNLTDYLSGAGWS